MENNPPNKNDPNRPPAPRLPPDLSPKLPPQPPPDKEEQSGLPADKINDVNYLVTYTRHLERRMKTMEEEKHLFDTERLHLERELHALRTELDRLRQPPLIEAKVIKVLPDQRALVESSTGPRFVVNMSKKTKGTVQAGQHVCLNQRTYAIVEVLLLDESEILKGSTPVPVKVVSTPDKEEK